ncbi:hypothetical protein [Planosporangium mesophilum]|nr:hypothetical protein [Planosporangium mesophilum]NJC85077.1 hypothetical protein [Planosporangium mesophilum]
MVIGYPTGKSQSSWRTTPTVHVGRWAGWDRLRQRALRPGDDDGVDDLMDRRRPCAAALATAALATAALATAVAALAACSSRERGGFPSHTTHRTASPRASAAPTTATSAPSSPAVTGQAMATLLPGMPPPRPDDRYAADRGRHSIGRTGILR